MVEQIMWKKNKIADEIGETVDGFEKLKNPWTYLFARNGKQQG